MKGETEFWILFIVAALPVLITLIWYFKGRNNSSNSRIINPPGDYKKLLLEQFFDQWKTRESHLWSNIYRVFYGILLLLFLPLFTRFILQTNESKSGAFQKAIDSFYNNNSSKYLWIGIILSIFYLVIGAIYCVRLRTAKATYDSMVDGFFKRITTSDLVGKWKISKFFFNLPVNPMIIYVQYLILLCEVYFVLKICFS